MDADVPKLLSVAERRDYSRKSLQAAVAKGSGLLPCPVPDCPGIAATGALISIIVIIHTNTTLSSPRNRVHQAMPGVVTSILT